MAREPFVVVRKLFVPDDYSGAKDQDNEACRSLWVAVIQKAMKDMAYVNAKGLQPGLTPSEREKIQRIYELDAPENFFRSHWFEEICRNLSLSASRIRTEILARYINADGSTPFGG